MKQKRLLVSVALAATALLAGCSHPADTSPAAPTSQQPAPASIHRSKADIAKEIQMIQSNPNTPPDKKAQEVSQLQQEEATAQ